MIRFFLLVIGILFVVGIALTGSFVWDGFFLSPEKDAVEFVMEIPSGASVDAIARMLEEQEVITSRFFFKGYVKLVGAQAELQAGEFALKKGMSLRDVVQKLERAEVLETQVTIPEGYTIQQIGTVVTLAFPNIHESDWKAMTDRASEVSVEGVSQGIPVGQSLEGYLFPDTYRFRNEVDAKTVVSTMLLTLTRRLAENKILIPDSNNLMMSNGMTFHEVLTLASIVEREVRSPEDMAHVAGIFLTRLKIGMALQADSTVNYVTGKKDAAVSLEDSRVESLYNTYKHLGLPPGPISNPGMNAIKAVLEPTDSDDLYFLTTPEGKVIYASTFGEHVTNKGKYLR